VALKLLLGGTEDENSRKRLLRAMKALDQVDSTAKPRPLHQR